MTDVTDLRSTIIPRSDQLNADQLLSGPITITVSDVRAGTGDDQPVSIFYDADKARPYKPCKTMRKVLILAWGADGTRWIGKSMELFADASVVFGGQAVGGIRIAKLSDIPAGIKVSLTATKGKKAMHTIGILATRPAIDVPPLDMPESEAIARVVALWAGCKTLADAKAVGSALKAQGRRDDDPVQVASKSAREAALAGLKNG